MLKKIILTTIIFVIMLVAMPALSATNLLFSTLAVKVNQGESFDLTLSIDPKGVKNYTVITELKYPSRLLQVTSFNFADPWLPVPQPDYDLINNDNGVMVKTAGFPGGFSREQVFGTATFKAIKSGQGLIEVGGKTISLDASSRDVISSSFPRAVVIIGEPGEPKIPEQLFDINLELDDNKVTDVRELTSRVIFISFGKVPTPVDLTFTILDATGEVIHSEKDYVVVETEQALERKFKEIDYLAPGNYTLLLKTLYNTSVEDEFRQDFEIITGKEKAMGILGSAWFWVVILVVIAVVITIAVVVKRQKKGVNIQ